MSATRWNLQWPGLPQAMDFDPANQIARGLTGAQQQPVSTWGEFVGGNRLEDGAGSNWIATAGPGNWSDLPAGFTPSGQGGTTISMGGDGGNANPNGYKAPGWDLTQNQYSYAIPSDFRANTNFYQHGYNQQQDTNRLDTAQGKQSNFDRVYAQMNDLAKANGYGDISQAPPEFQQWASGAAIGRLRTDYQKTGADWNTSGFAGYDQYLQGGQRQQGGTAGVAAAGSVPPGAGTTTRTAAAPTGQAPPATGGTPGQTGGAPMSAPMATTPGNQPYPSAGPTPGGGAGPITGGAGNSLDVGGAYNAKNPQDVIRDFMRQHGIDPNVNSGFGTFVQGLMSKIVPVLFQNMYGGDGKMALDQIGNPMDMLNGIFASGTGNLGGNLNNFANSALGQVQGNAGLRNLAPDVMKRMMTDLNALQTYGMNPYQSLASQDSLDKALSGYDDRNYQSAHGGAPNNQSLWDYIAQNAGSTIGLR